MDDIEKKNANYERVIYLLEELLHTYKCRLDSISNSEEYCRRKRTISLISLIENIGDNVTLASSMSSYTRNAESLRKNVRQLDIEVEMLKKRIVERYQYYSFKDSSDFRYIIYPDGIGICKYIGFNDFEVEIPCNIDGLPVIRIESYAFYKTPFKSITIPESVVDIGDWAFAYCQNLNRINLPNKLISVGDSCFYCSGLEKICINVETIPTSCFYLCWKLKKVILGYKVRKISKFAFSHLGIERLIIPESVELVECDAFNLVNSKFPTHIREIAFEGMKGKVECTAKVKNADLIVYCLSGSEAYEASLLLGLKVRKLEEYNTNSSQ